MTNASKHLFKLLFALILTLVLLTLFVLNASRPGARAEGCPDGCSNAPDRRAGPLRVLSLNMLHGIPWFERLGLRVDLIAAEIKRLDADVVLLQEVPWTVRTGNVAARLAQELGYNYLYYRANANRHLIFFEEGEAILSRFLLEDAAFTELNPPMSFFENRVALGAKALTPWGEVSFFVAHLTNKDDRVGAGQADSLREFVEAHNAGLALVGGDFNAFEDSPQIRQLASAWTDTYRRAHPNDPGSTCCVDDLRAAPGELLEERIDYIFLEGEFHQLVRAEHAFYSPFRVSDGWQWASDHTGLLVELEP